MPDGDIKRVVTDAQNGESGHEIIRVAVLNDADIQGLQAPAKINVPLVADYVP